MMSMIESIQYMAGLLVTGCWYGTSRIIFYKNIFKKTMKPLNSLNRMNCIVNLLGLKDTRERFFLTVLTNGIL